VLSILLQNETGARLQLIPYRGEAPALQDLAAGQIDLMFVAPVSSMPHVHGGTIKAFAITDTTRLPMPPDIPTTDEAGLPGFHFIYWQSLWAPKGTPKELLVRLNAVVVETLADRSVRARFAELGLEVFPRAQQNPAALAIWQRAEIAKLVPIIKAAGLRGE
jgi:tripartite-type tricarboxylate transporter receptor subunit TctC